MEELETLTVEQKALTYEQQLEVFNQHVQRKVDVTPDMPDNWLK